MDTAQVSVLISRFEDLVAYGLRALVTEDPNLSLVGTDVAPRALDAVDRRAPAVGGDPQLRLAAHPGRGARAARRASRARGSSCSPTTRRPCECNQLLAFGATACLSKETQARDVLNAIHLASRGLQVLPRTPREPGSSSRSGPELLTPREADVLELLQGGRTNAEIAQQLHVGVETVRTHARNIYRKLGVRTRRDLSVPAGLDLAARR